MIIATDGSMISGRVDDVMRTEEDQKDLVAVGEGGQCMKCLGFFSIMILLPALVFMFIHLGNNDWKFKIGDGEIDYKDIEIPSVKNCNGEFLLGRSIKDVFNDDFKKHAYIDDEL